MRPSLTKVYLRNFCHFQKGKDLRKFLFSPLFLPSHFRRHRRLSFKKEQYNVKETYRLSIIYYTECLSLQESVIYVEPLPM